MDFQLKLPDFMKKTDKVCKEHGVPIYIIHGKEHCGECDLNKFNSVYRASMRQNCDDNRLKDYYENKKNKKSSSFSRGDV